MASGFDSTAAFGEEHQPKGLFRRPVIVLSHLGFRSTAVLAYVFAKMYTNSFIVQFLMITFLLSLDFWAVKNITGRLLVGMRWWNFVDADGQNHWRFESRKDQSKTNMMEARVFWLALVICPAAWVMLAALAFFTLSWEYMVVAVMGAAMTSANLYGYLRCKWSSRQELTNFLSKTVLLSMLTRGAGGGSEPQRPMSTA